MSPVVYRVNLRPLPPAGVEPARPGAAGLESAASTSSARGAGSDGGRTRASGLTGQQSAANLRPLLGRLSTMPVPVSAPR